jgi:hypothetical protein
VDESAPAKPEETTVPPAGEKPTADGPKLEIKPYDAARQDKPAEPAK